MKIFEGHQAIQKGYKLKLPLSDFKEEARMILHPKLK